jgi:hypothetical protein
MTKRDRLRASKLLTEAYMATGVNDFVRPGAPLLAPDLPRARKNIVTVVEMLTPEFRREMLV